MLLIQCKQFICACFFLSFFFDVVIIYKIVKDFFSDDVPDFSNH